MTTSTCVRTRPLILDKRIGVAAILAAFVLLAADVPAQKAPKPDKLDKRDKTPQAPPIFFDSEDPLAVTLTANIGRLRRDKSPNPPWRAATLSYTSAEATTVTVPIKARTRGIWRLKTCEFPPLRLNFSGEQSKGTVFQRLDKPKLVSFCRDTDGYEQYVLQELQLYRAYQLLTPVSHKVRLLRVAYTDSASGKVHATRHAILLEEPDALAARLGGRIVEHKGALPGDLDPFFDALVGVFQYFIGNTDFSSAALHNMELLQKPDGTMVPLAYDFDFSGAVNATYATVDPKLTVTHVRARLFRGYCTEGDAFAKIFALFNEKKDQIYALYGDPVGKLLDPRVARETLQYFDAFYRTINDSRLARREILEACIARP